MASVKFAGLNYWSRSGLDGEAVRATRPMLLRQLGLYFIVGGICFFIDVGGFVVLRLCGLPILLASALSFVTATLVNYSLCCAFVFRRGRFSRPEEIGRLFMIALVGLGLNSLAVLLLTRFLEFNPTLAKILAVLPVFAWNYLGRRKLVFDGSLSPVSRSYSGRARFDHWRAARGGRSVLNSRSEA